MTIRLDHVSVTTADLAASLAFYRDLLGLPLVGRGEMEGTQLETIVGLPGAKLLWAELALGGGQVLELLQYLSPQDEGLDPRPWLSGATHIGLAVEDVDALFARLTEAGVPVRSDPVEIHEDGSWNGVRVLYASDPDRVTVELVERPRVIPPLVLPDLEAAPVVSE
jgi:catechol 2,3-dioxygenase-like lactoylglutathione lyase family enzyme